MMTTMTIFIVILSLILIVAGAAGIYLAYHFYKKAQSHPEHKMSFSLIFTISVLGILTVLCGIGVAIWAALFPLTTI